MLLAEFNSKKLLLLSFLLGFCFLSTAQEYDDVYDDEQDPIAGFYIGANVGAFFSNNNTAIIYNGTPSSTPFGINYILTLPNLQQTFNDFFQFPFALDEFPIESRYRTTAVLGVHLGYQFNSGTTVFVELNTASLTVEQVFTIAIDDPTNQIIGPTFEQFPIIGEESRFNLNFGTQLSLYYEEGTNFYFSLFGNINDTELDRNYIVIDNVSYEIFHQEFDNPNFRPGGIGYGGGTGLGLVFPLTEKISSDIYYQLQYSRTNLREELQPFGIHHTLGLRVLWRL